ncbi:MAG: hypothetical protein ACLFO2_04120 [Candidatus Woesearchaeota archaeon]
MKLNPKKTLATAVLMTLPFLYQTHASEPEKDEKAKESHTSMADGTLVAGPLVSSYARISLTPVGPGTQDTTYVIQTDHVGKGDYSIPLSGETLDGKVGREFRASVRPGKDSLSSQEGDRFTPYERTLKLYSGDNELKILNSGFDGR